MVCLIQMNVREFLIHEAVKDHSIFLEDVGWVANRYMNSLSSCCIRSIRFLLQQ